LNETKANIDLESHILTLYNDLVGTNLISDKEVIVRTADAVLIPPKSEALIPALIPPYFGSGLSIIEPSMKLYKLQLALAKSMVSPVRNRAVFKSAIVYLDDVLILSKDFADHYKHLRMLFQKFKDANLRMNGKKCNFAIDHIKYIGHTLSKDGIGIDPSKTEVISSWPRPKNAKHIRSFLGLINFYKRFVHKFAQRSAPLRNLLSKEVSFEWGEEQEKYFQDLKQALLSPPILRFPDTSRPLHLQLDTSLDGLSYILGHTDDSGRKYVISYGGRGLRP